MKVKVVWTVFVIALVALLTLQFVFLYHTYGLRQEAIKEDLNTLFKAAAEKEIGNRFLNSSRIIKANPEKYNNLSYTVQYGDDNKRKIEEQGIMSVKFQENQQFMEHVGFSFDATALDSLYRSSLFEKGVEVDYSLFYKDSTAVIQTLGEAVTVNFETQAIPIVKKKTIQAQVTIPMPFVFKGMFGILITSVLLLFFIVGCLLYEMRIIFSQRRLTRLREDFSNALIHDMKTPLNTIYMAIDQWGKGRLDNDPAMRSKFCTISMEQVLNLQALSDKILTIARLEEGKVTIEKKLVAIPELLRSLENKFRLQAKKEMNFQTSVRMDNDCVMADPTYLSNAISNMIDNAIKYSGNSVAIQIDCHTTADGLIIEVADNGFGISLKDQKAIFEKFERGAAVLRKGAKGFGLGLNYVKRVMEAHGGTITLSSMEGKGSSFVLFIPQCVTPIEIKTLT